MRSALDFSAQKALGQDLETLRLAVVVLIFLKLGSVSHFLLMDVNAFVEVEHTEITRQRMPHNDFVFEDLVAVGFGFSERLGFVQVVGSHAGDPSPEVGNALLWADILVVDDLPVVIHN